MKNIKIKMAFVTLIGFFSITSCTDILDQEPMNITHSNVFWVNESNAEQALAGSYALFKNAITYQANFLYWGEFTGMTFMNSGQWITDYIEGSGNYVLAYRGRTINWGQFYKVANWANTIEHKVNDMDTNLFSSEAEKNRIMGEAAFLRGLSYFWVARIWGDAPIVEEVIESASQLVTEDGFVVENPRVDELKVLDHALAAANKAIELLEYSSPGSNNWAITANKASAEALKAHILLWYASREGYVDQQKLRDAVDVTTSVINNSNTELIDYVVEGKKGFDKMCIGQSKTGLFEINNSLEMGESLRMNRGAVHYTALTLNYPIFKTKNPNVAPVIDPEFYGKQMMDSDAARDNDVRKTLFFNDYESDTDSFPLKYSHTSQDPDVDDEFAQFLESNILIFRLADMYLLRAEANTKLGEYGLAKDDLDMIRAKAGSLEYAGTLDEENLMKAIFDERAIEFVAEAQSGYDRIRMNYYEGVPWMNQTRIAKEGYFWPIANGMITNNPALVQTPYWQGQL